jgi:hypothetical protein
VRGERLQRLVEGGRTVFVPVAVELLDEWSTWSEPVVVRIERDPVDELLVELVLRRVDEESLLSFARRRHAENQLGLPKGALVDEEPR